MPAAVAPRAMARATSRPVPTPPVATIVSKPCGARRATDAAVGTPQSQNASPSARAARRPRPRRAASRRRPTTCLPRPRRRRASTPTSRRRRPTAGEMPQPVSLTTTGTPRSRTRRAIVSRPCEKSRSPPGLHQLHRRVQVNAQRVGADLVDQDAHLARRHRARLHHAHVAEDERRRRDVAHAVRLAGARAHVHRALAAEAEAVPALLGDARELAVDAPGLVGAARHRRDERAGARSVLPKSVTDVSTSASAMSGSASCTRRTCSSSVDVRVEADVLLGAEGQVVGLALADRRHRGVVA